MSVEKVLVVPRRVLERAGMFQGFTDRAADILPALLADPDLHYMPRDVAETDPEFKQLIPYVVLRFHDRLFHYQRAGGGEKRLHAKKSVGVGGHICSDDGEVTADAYRAGMLRELAEEVELLCEWSEKCVGLINDDATPVGAVHLGVVHLLDVSEPEVRCREATMRSLGFAPVEALRRDAETFETWSRLVLAAV